MANLKEVRSNDMRGDASANMNLEAIVIPVSNVDRAKNFYKNLGWRLDADFAFDNGFRIVQFTPPGSGCSIQFGTNVTPAKPGSARGLYLVVSDIGAARDEIAARNVAVSEVFTPECRALSSSQTVVAAVASAAPPNNASYDSFATFNDPDSNGWLLQEITTRLPGRIDIVETAFASENELASALRRAAAAHGQHEKRIGEADPNMPRLVCQIYGGGTGWQRTAAINEYHTGHPALIARKVPVPHAISTSMLQAKRALSQ